MQVTSAASALVIARPMPDVGATKANANGPSPNAVAIATSVRLMLATTG